PGGRSEGVDGIGQERQATGKDGADQLHHDNKRGDAERDPQLFAEIWRLARLFNRMCVVMTSSHYFSSNCASSRRRCTQSWALLPVASNICSAAATKIFNSAGSASAYQVALPCGRGVISPHSSRKLRCLLTVDCARFICSTRSRTRCSPVDRCCSRASRVGSANAWNRWA